MLNPVRRKSTDFVTVHIIVFLPLGGEGLSGIFYQDHRQYETGILSVMFLDALGRRQGLWVAEQG